jgi:hypothetical protein
MKNVLVLSNLNGKFRIVECYQRKNIWLHNNDIIFDGFENKKNAINYCNIFKYNIKNL